MQQRPLSKAKTIETAIDKVKNEEYDSAFTVKPIQEFLWMDGAACYNTNKIPRTQDIQNVFAETTGLYVYTKKLIKDGRRIGSNPYGVTVDFIEATDINNPIDFDLAQVILIITLRIIQKAIITVTMSNIKILDCTLRDGGYVNNWHFGRKAIETMLFNFSKSNTDIVECGFLTNKPYDPDYSLYNSVEQLNELVSSDSSMNTMYVAMIAIGEREINPVLLSEADSTVLDGIRLTFHPNEIDLAFEWAEIIKSKGYKLFYAACRNYKLYR